MIIVPSLLDREAAARRASLKRFVKDDPFIKRLGNGMVVDASGRVALEKRATMPSQMETEEMAWQFMKFREFMGELGIQPNAQERAEDRALAMQARGKAAPTAKPEVRTTDPNLAWTYAQPQDFTNEFGTPVDQTEIIALCEETSVYNALPEVINNLYTESWREITALAMASGTNYIAFPKGACPEGLAETSTGRTLDKKHIGVMHEIAESDILHSIGSIAAGYGINEIIGAFGATEVNGTRPESLPSMLRATISDVKEKEIQKSMIEVINGWDELLVSGSANANANEFSGLENLVTAANGARTNTALGSYSGTYNQQKFDEWLAAGCARPTHLFGHPTALQAVKLSYWQNGASTGAVQQVVSYPSSAAGEIVPGWTFANQLQTSIGPLQLVPDINFTRTDIGNGTFSSNIYALRMVHNGEPLVYKATQIPLAYRDLSPGCSAIRFMIWAVTGLVVKAYCAQGFYRAFYSGLAQAACSRVHSG